jgi:Holliday junction resolvase RusA-like endonuclease
MQTDILLKQLQSSLAELKISIEKFEKHPSPSTQYAENLHLSIQHTNKLVSAYLVLKEHKDVSPDLNLHLKIMNEQQSEEKKAVIDSNTEVIQVATFAPKVTEDGNLKEVAAKPVGEKLENAVEVKLERKVIPKMVINLNDKFRVINELFAANTTEYNIAIEQIDNVTSKNDLENYLKGLQSIYNWNDDNEIVKTFFSLAKKRFA